MAADTVEEQLTQKFDELCSVEPSKVMLDIYEYEKTHANKVLTNYGRFVSQFELYYDLTIEITHAVNYINKSDWPEHRGAQFLLLAHNLKSIFSAFDRLIHGFYEDSLILLRPAYESFIKIIYITCFPGDPYFSIVGKRDGSKEKFNFTDFVKQKLKLTWNNYSIFSSTAHANKYSVLKEAINIKLDGQKSIIGLKFQYDKKMLELGINSILFLQLVYLRTVVELFATKSNHILKIDLLNKAKILINLREQVFLLHEKDYWPMVVGDIRDIFKLIGAVENGSNWKEEWETIRSKP